jgi:hypothetical protein
MPPFDQIALIDNHLHPLLTAEAAAGRPFAAFFSEADDPDLIERHVSHGRFFRRAVRDIAALLGCDPEVEAVQEARTTLGPERLLRRCVEAGNVAGLVVDDGYPPPDQAISVAEMARAAACPAVRVLRLETVVARLVQEHERIQDLLDGLWLTLEAARGFGTVALKSVIAYRCGLAYRRPTPEEADAGLRAERERAGGGAPRVSDPRLLYTTLRTAINWAGERELPVQIHTGYGDRDLDLVQADPALLRPLLEEPVTGGCRIVLLHAGYPYTRTASYLAAMYRNVYVDFSEANPMLPVGELARVVEELLALAPPTKLLYGSDAWGVPDWIYLGALYGRQALAAALSDDPDAAFIARRVLHDNAAELYGFV